MKIAIVGMGAVLPGCKSIQDFWLSSVNAKDLSSEPPVGRWGEEAHCSSMDLRDRCFHKRGYFVEHEQVDGKGLHLDGALLERLDPVFHMALRAGRDAFFDCQWDAIDRSRTGLILGNIALPSVKSSQLVSEIIGESFEELVTGQASDGPSVDPHNYYSASLPARLLSKALGLGLDSFSIDAACASSLYALKIACDYLCSGQADAMLAGGFNGSDGLFTQMGFSQLQALSPSGHSRPFDQEADGLMVGEGGAVFMLKRLEDAVAHGDHIYGVIRGIGLSNDLEGGLMAPSSDGQLQAMRAAYEGAGWQPNEVDYIECHATGTPLGDQVELESYSRLWQGLAGDCVLSSVKGNIGHLLTGAGASGLVRTLLCMEKGVLPPSANCRQMISMAEGPFRVLSQGESWQGKGSRKAAISGFGFGGINAHVLVEEYHEDLLQVEEAARERQLRPVAVVAYGSLLASERSLDNPRTWKEGGDQASRWFGVENSSWFKGRFHISEFKLKAFESLHIPYQQFKIPPKELQELLPQQIMALAASREAFEDADGLSFGGSDSGVFVGVQLDGLSSAYRSRWALEQKAKAWDLSLALGLSEDQREAWAEQLKDAFYPALNADRVMGSLASIIPSRIAREYQVSGPSYAVSGMDQSGLYALKLAVDGIQSGELKQSLVVGVDQCAQLLPMMADRMFCDALGSSREKIFEDAAIAVLVKDYEQALQDGDKIYGVIENMSCQGDGREDELQDQDFPVVGHPYYQGAATGLCQFLERLLLYQKAYHESWQKEDFYHFQYGDKDNASYHVRVKGVRQPSLAGHRAIEQESGGIEIKIAGDPFVVPEPPRTQRQVHGASQQQEKPIEGGYQELPSQVDFVSLLMNKMKEAEEAGAEAQEAYEKLSLSAIQYSQRMVENEVRDGASTLGLFLPEWAGDEVDTAYEAGAAGAAVDPSAIGAVYPVLTPREVKPSFYSGPLSDEKALYDYAACEEFAAGSIAKVFGEDFAFIDAHPTRVRLPMDRLLLCHRVMDIQGEAFSLKAGSMVTEHDVHEDAWYLDHSKIPAAIAIEAGQADLMLSAWLGADQHTEGRALYRLLDAKVTFYRDLPSPGEIIRYEIAIENFFRRGSTLMFRFGFKAFVGDQPLMTMSDGCAGFFTPEELASGKGIVDEVAPQISKGRFTGGYLPAFHVEAESYDDRQVGLLREGRLGECFGSQFAARNLLQPVRLPTGDLNLVHRIRSMDTYGGKYQVGSILGEADVDPNAWYLSSHFKDDPVMPGTLMYECCLHTMRVFLMRHGFIAEDHHLSFEPVLGRSSQLKCRGQVLASTQKVQYEIHIKEIGFGPEAYAIADAYMYADDRCIVDITDMTLRVQGLDKKGFTKLWRDQEERPLLSYEQIVEFSTGLPSNAFGPTYKVFDYDRKLARLPRHPYQLITEFVSSDRSAFEMKGGGKAEARYVLPENAWYFAAENNHGMPYSILVEVALQACGSFAAYMGSALCSDEDLFFRNLQGTATLHQQVDEGCKELRTQVQCTKVSQSAQMIIQEYSFMVLSSKGRILSGHTTFGFFTEDALAQQAGLKGRQVPELSRRLPASEPLQGAGLPKSPLLMIDYVEPPRWDEGLYGLGRIKAYKSINPQEWFFHAHFYQDPVMPGSLGLEAIIQTAKQMARKRWPEGKGFEVLPVAHHEWLYRGQVRPYHDEMVVDLHLSRIDEDAGLMVFDAYLYVDGLAIYQASGFSVQQRY